MNERTSSPPQSPTFATEPRFKETTIPPMKEVYRSNAKKKQDTRRAAEGYLRRGLGVIPVPRGEKNPGRDEWQKEHWTPEDVHDLWDDGQDIGVLWGEPSGGLVDIDCDWTEATIAARGIVPRRRTFGRPGSPESHHVVRIVGELPKTKRYGLPGKGEEKRVVELLSTGTQSLVPPSLHESGERRRWYGKDKPIEMTASEALEATADIASAALLACNWPGQGSRKDYSFAATGYVGRYLSRERAFRVMEAAIAASGDEEAHGRLRDALDTLDKIDAGEPTSGGPTLDDLAPGVVEQLKRWHGWGSEGKGGSPRRGDDEDRPTDDELRDRFIERHAEYAFGLGTWRRYGGGIWEPASELMVKDRVCRVLEDAKGEKVRPNKSVMTSVAELAKVRLAVDDDVWDANPNILVCANGALNLETRELLPHSREHFATSAAPYDYDEDAQSDVWEQRVMGELIADHFDLATMRFFQEFAGYCLTIDTSHEIALWLTGRHGGGRSTILAGLKAMLGPRAGVLSLSDIERSSFALTNLPGKTLVSATEQPGTFLRGGGVLNAIISGEPIQVDIKFKDPVVITPRCKVAWAMNEVPRVGNPDDGIFRRVKILSIPEIPEEDQDPEIKEIVERSGAAILNWALEGLDRLQERGRFEIPDKVKSATEEFRKDNDVVGLFVAEMCDVDKKYWEKSSNLYEGYKEWALDSGHKPLSSTSIVGQWRRLGFEPQKDRDFNKWTGVKLKTGSYYEINL
jgi:P4 family phage/plasmid primase-like protien